MKRRRRLIVWFQVGALEEQLSHQQQALRQGGDRQRTRWQPLYKFGQWDIFVAIFKAGHFFPWQFLGFLVKYLVYELNIILCFSRSFPLPVRVIYKGESEVIYCQLCLCIQMQMSEKSTCNGNNQAK